MKSLYRNLGVGILVLLASACSHFQQTDQIPTPTAEVSLSHYRQEVTPGKTTRANALESLGLPYDAEKRRISWPSGYYWSDSAGNSTPRPNAIEFDEQDIVEVLSLWVEDGTTFDDIIATFGEPDLIIYGVLNPGEAPWQRVGLVYLEKGALFMTNFDYAWSAGDQVNIDMPPQPDMKVVEQVYFVPKTAQEFDEQLYSGFGSSFVGIGGRIEWGNNYTRPWEGFGK